MEPKSIECFLIGYPEEYRGLNFFNIRSKQIFIERSVLFEEPLQEVELVKEKTVEIPSCSADHLDDESESEGYDIAYMMYDISEKHISGS